jgi:hypothetical protein
MDFQNQRTVNTDNPPPPRSVWQEVVTQTPGNPSYQRDFQTKCDLPPLPPSSTLVIIPLHSTFYSLDFG